MKKVIFLFITFLFAVLFLNAQDRTVSRSMKENYTYYKYDGVAADTLTENQDTIDFVLQYRSDWYVKKLAVKTKFDLVSGVDTTVTTSVFGKEFYDDTTYVQVIAAVASDDINANNTVQILTSDYTESVGASEDTFNADSTITVAAKTVTPLDKSYRYYRVRYIYTGSSAAGSGVKIDDIEFKFYID